MRRDIFKEYTYQIVQKRNFAYLMVCLLSIISLLEGIALLSKSQKVILIPQNNLEKRIVFEGNRLEDTYLVDWAHSILVSLMTVNPQTVNKKVKDFLSLSLSSDALTKLVAKQAKMIEQDRISTVFYPSRFRVNQKDQIITVTGSFMAFIGSDMSIRIEN